uniref:Glutaredoxin domain-containing protein n=1 Tax=Davidia involucrata TaxID=16924 RepID=A0A5B6Z555_DAVIN
MPNVMAFQSIPSSIRTPFLVVKASAIAAVPSLLCYPRPSRSPYTCRPLTVGDNAIVIGVASRRIKSTRCLAALTPELRTTLDKVVTSHKVILFMKGTKEFPQCGFSNTVVQILKSQNVPFETIDILENEMLRQGLKEYSSWPTFPQLYIDGEFFGGCDITVEAYKNGQLQELLEKSLCS